MPLREELILKKPNDDRVLEIQQIGQHIVDGIFAGDDVSDKIEAIAKITGRNDYDFDYFKTLRSHSSVEEFAEKAALPTPQRVPDITREELIEIVKLIMAGDFPDSEHCLELLEINVPMSGVSDLIYWPETDDPSPEEIVDKALSSPDNVIHL